MVTVPAAPASAEPAEYVFTPAEASVVKPAFLEFQRMQGVVSALAHLIASQQSLDGPWNIKQDGTGLVKVG